MTTKSQVINESYAEMRISGITVDPSTDDVALALSKLESMMAQYFYQWNMDVGYNFEATPATSSQTNVQLQFKQMMVTNLAVRLVAAFGKAVPPSLGGLARSAFSSALGMIVSSNMRQIAPPTSMPSGSGNTFRQFLRDRYANPTNLPPNDSETNQILKGETFTYQEDFSAWLGANTIASFTLTVDPLLTLDASANADPLITYTITANSSSAGEGPWQIAKITVTDSAGRVDIRLVNFYVQTPPDVP